MCRRYAPTAVVATKPALVMRARLPDVNTYRIALDKYRAFQTVYIIKFEHLSTGELQQRQNEKILHSNNVDRNETKKYILPSSFR